MTHHSDDRPAAIGDCADRAICMALLARAALASIVSQKAANGSGSTSARDFAARVLASHSALSDHNGKKDPRRHCKENCVLRDLTPGS